MNVYHVFQVVRPDHNTSYKTGRNWMMACDTEQAAGVAANEMNATRSGQCVGVEYTISGPHDETVDVKNL